MSLEFDLAKNAINQAKHGLSFLDFPGFDAQPTVVADTRSDYGEVRLRAFGRIAGLPHCLVFTMSGNTTRAISFRRAHEKEMRRYE